MGMLQLVLLLRRAIEGAGADMGAPRIKNGEGAPIGISLSTEVVVPVMTLSIEGCRGNCAVPCTGGPVTDLAGIMSVTVSPRIDVTMTEVGKLTGRPENRI